MRMHYLFHSNLHTMEQSKKYRGTALVLAMVATVSLSATVMNSSSISVPPRETHLACKSSSCVPVPGSGMDQCETNEDCGGVTVTHLECANFSCVPVPGPDSAPDLCATDADCD